MKAALPKKALTWFAGILYGYLFLAGFIGYEGTKSIYLLYSASFTALLVTGIYKPVSYSYMFLAVFLWLGFWFKFTANYFLFGFMPFGEPVGYFDGSMASWDHAFIVGITGSVGVMLARLVYRFTGFASTVVVARDTVVPIWYEGIRKWLWLALALGITGLAVLNALLGIQQSGLVPRTTLHWPLNAVIYWLLSTGFSMILATLLWWDVSLKKSLLAPIFVACGEAFFSTVSLLSRSTYIFHVIPLLASAYANWRIVAVSAKRQVLILGVFLVLFAVSILAVSHLRDFYYAAPAPVAAATISTAPPKTTAEPNQAPPTPISSFRLILLHQLIVNRWIGLEGAAAVAAYPLKGTQLFFKELTAHSAIGIVDEYQKISNSDYQHLDSTKYQFSSLPGAIAFFYYSGSLWYVLGGMFFLAFVSTCAERVVSLLTGNVFLCAIFGSNLANAISQLGVTPRQLGPHLAMIAGGVLFITLVQSNRFSSLVARLRRTPK